MREVYINEQQVDVNQEDGVDIIYESPIFSDISKIKSNTTTTYTLPKTDRNLAILQHADQHDVVSDHAYKEWDFEEYRNGLPIIQNGKCRLLKIGDRIELAVVWGTKVALSEKLGKKLNELHIDNPLYNIYEDACKVSDDFILASDNTSEIGFLHANYGVDSLVNNYTWRVPSVTVRRIFKIIEKACGIKIDFKKKNSSAPTDVDALLKTKWIPFYSNTTNDDDEVDNAGKKIAKFKINALEGYNNEHPDFLFSPDENYNNDYKLFDIRSDSYFSNFLIPKGTSWLDIDLSLNFIGNKSSSKIRVALLHKKDSASPTTTEVLGDYTPVYNAEKDRSFIDLKLLKAFDLKYEGHKCEFRLFNVDANGHASELRFRQENTGHNLSVGAQGKLTVANPNGQKQLVYPVVPNLPDMTCVDFIKSICNMYALFPYYNFETETLEFLQIEDISNKENIANAKNWDNKVIAEPWSIERSFGDYAKYNRFRYADDDTVTTVSQGYLELDNNLLVAEKDLIDLKFSATDQKWTLFYYYNYLPYYYNVAYLPYFVRNSSDKVEFQSIKPRMLSERVIKIEDGETSLKCKSLIFDELLKFQGEKGLIKTYYGRYKDVVERPVVRDVTVLLNEVELMNMSTLDVIYLRGKYWMPIKVQVGISGKAKARLMMLPKVF